MQEKISAKQTKILNNFTDFRLWLYNSEVDWSLPKFSFVWKFD